MYHNLPATTNITTTTTTTSTNPIIVLVFRYMIGNITAENLSVVIKIRLYVEVITTVHSNIEVIQTLHNSSSHIPDSICVW